MLRLRGFMFQNVYLGPDGAGRAREDRARHARAVRVVLRAPRRAAGAGGRRVGGRPRDRLPGGNDRPLRHPRLDRARGAPGPAASSGALHRRFQGARPRRDRLRRAGRRAHGAAQVRAAALHGAVPVPRRADAVVRHRPGREALPLLRVRRGRRRLQVRDGDRGAGLRVGAGVAGRARRGRARGRAGGSAGGEAPRPRGAPAGAARADRGLLRAGAVGVEARPPTRASTCSAAG